MSANAPIPIYKPYLPPPQFEALDPPEARREIESYFGLLNEVWEERDRQLISAMHGLVLGFGMALDNLSDVVITAASTDDFLKFDGTDWVNFPLLTTANTWGATQNVQHLIPTADATYDLGSSANGFRTLYANNPNGIVFQLPTAAGTGAPSIYSLVMGGGGDGTEGGIAAISMDDCTGGGFNEFVLNLGALGAPGPINTFIMRSLVGGSVGLVEFDLGFQLTLGTPRLDFRLKSIDFGGGAADMVLGFVNRATDTSDTATRMIAFGHQLNSGTNLDHLTIAQNATATAVVNGSLVVFRAPSNTVANCFFSSGTAASTYSFVWFRGPGAIAPTAPATRARISNVQIDPPGISSVSTIADAASLYISAAPTFGTANWSLWVDAGDTRLDGTLVFGSTTGARLSAAAGVLTMAGLSGTAENLTWDFTAANVVTVASGTGVTDLVLSFANVRTTTALEIDGTLNHDGAAVGFFGAAPATQPTYTQTFATADRTHAATATGAALTDSTGGTANTTLVAITATGDDANINDNFADLALRSNELRTDLDDVRQLVNAIIDDLQLYGLFL